MQNILSLLFTLLRLAAVLLLLPYAIDWRTPELASIRLAAFAVLLALPIIVIGVEIRTRAPTRRRRLLQAIVGLVAATVAVLTLSREARFYWVRHQVLTADPAQLERLGRHIIVGFRDLAELRALIELRAVAGVYLTARNVQGQEPKDIRRIVDGLQAARAAQDLPPLWIATDQEGGNVSHLSPPLTRLPPLADVVQAANDPAERHARVEQYATTQANELASVGVNLNFAPVVDLNFHVVNANDHYSRIFERAISDDPQTVRDVAEAYCRSLLAGGVRCTLKHFPGLGRVQGDTHVDTADLTAPVAELAQADWIPFRALVNSGALTMVSHARLTAIDAGTPASFSRPVIDILRHDWNDDGLLVSDDFSMAAVYRSHAGLAGAGVAALNAGIDLILISFDSDQVYDIIDALMRAERSGALHADALRASDRRLALTKPSDRAETAHVSPAN